ncbi:MAG: DUF805 domain-containing protein [Thiotrichaceae bacterium]|nr:DUF805 domain-containing protein [Thiotrichaceae bacterium]
MINALLKEIKTGRLLRLQYLGYSLFMGLLVVIFIAALVFAIGAGEHLLGGNLQDAQNQLREWFTLPLMIVFGIFMASMLFIGFNLMAKRIRDIGLPGWWSILVIMIISGALSYAVSQQASSGFHTLIWILLVLVPTNTLEKSKGLYRV